MIVYKLTDKDGYTRRGKENQIKWQVGTVKTVGGKGDLCTDQWIHAYEHPILAVLHDPVHGEYGDTTRMWECETDDGVIKRDGQMKLGTTKLHILREMKKPKVTLYQRIAYAISCSLRVYAEESYVLWAEGWLSGKDRSKKSAAKAAEAAEAAEARAAALAEWAAAEAARAGARAAEAARAGARAAEAAEWAGARAAEAAESTVVTDELDLIDCAREAFLLIKYAKDNKHAD
jgi:hypothetical protein